MTIWSDPAREELERWLESARAAASRERADPAEVAEDLRRHVEEEAATLGLAVVTAEDLRRIVQRVGVGPAAPAEHPAPTEAAAAPRETPLKARPLDGPPAFTLICGIFLPMVAILAELGSGWSAGIYFDPIPTGWHVALLFVVPLANLVMAFTGSGSRPRFLRLANVLNGAALGVASVYTVIFMPMVPAGLLASLVIVGFLPLAPILALWATLSARRLLARGSTTLSLRGPALAFSAVLLAFIVADLPALVTIGSLRAASSEDPGESATGLAWLRRVGSEDLVLRVSYGDDLRGAGFLTRFWSARGVDVERVRRVYFRLTGQSWDSMPEPPRHRLQRSWDPDRPDLGASGGGPAAKLELSGSRLDGVVETAAAICYAEWTLTLGNAGLAQAEAVGRVRLPPGAVVSRATLWVGDEEQEAAFAGRGAATQAYQNVVSWRRDPLLVTTSGPDAITLRCFPVPAGGRMKVRVGFTAPLVLDPDQGALFVLPRFVDRNFSAAASLAHAVWFEADGPVQTTIPPLSVKPLTGGRAAVHGTLTEDQWNRPGGVMKAIVPAPGATCWTPDARQEPPSVVRQRIEEEPLLPYHRVVLVVDGSAAMAEHRRALAAAIEHWPDGIDTAVLLAGERTEKVLWPAQRATAAELRAAATVLGDLTCTGGVDCTEALAAAWSAAGEVERGAVIWVHGPAVLGGGPLEAVFQEAQRAPTNPVLFDFQTTSGPDRIGERADGLPSWKAGLRLGDFPSDLSRLLDRLAHGGRRLVARRTREAGAADGASAVGLKVSDHLARLWAKDEIDRCLIARGSGPADSAIVLGSTYRLVTPVTGAVALENRAQVEAQGLQPVSAADVPHVGVSEVPEPEEWALLCTALLALAGWFVKERRAPRRVAA